MVRHTSTSSVQELTIKVRSLMLRRAQQKIVVLDDLVRFYAEVNDSHPVF